MTTIQQPQINSLEDFNQLLTNADDGNAEAQFAVGLCFYSGRYLKGGFVARNHQKALHYMTLARDRGHAGAGEYMQNACFSPIDPTVPTFTTAHDKTSILEVITGGVMMVGIAGAWLALIALGVAAKLYLLSWIFDLSFDLLGKFTFIATVASLPIPLLEYIAKSEPRKNSKLTTWHIPIISARMAYLLFYAGLWFGYIIPGGFELTIRSWPWLMVYSALMIGNVPLLLILLSFMTATLPYYCRKVPISLTQWRKPAWIVPLTNAGITTWLQFTWLRLAFAEGYGVPLENWGLLTGLGLLWMAVLTYDYRRLMVTASEEE